VSEVKLQKVECPNETLPDYFVKKSDCENEIEPDYFMKLIP